jgi:hypothetical protein
MSGNGNGRRDGENNSGGGNNGDRFEKWMMTIMAGLAAAGVAGLWSMSTSVARLEERLANWVVASERLFAQIAYESTRQREALEKMRDRINVLESVVLSTSSPYPQRPQRPQPSPSPPDTGRYALPPANGERRQ